MFASLTTGSITNRALVIGGPTVLLEFGGCRLIVDPTFDPAGPQGHLTKMADPALSPEAVGHIDAVLLSHDLHADNFDVEGRRLAMGCPVIVTNPSSAARLGPPAHALRNWESIDLDQGSITVTAVPAEHGPADGETDPEGNVNCEVSGFVLQGTEIPTTYVSGDNASLRLVSQIAESFGHIDMAIVFAGAARVPTKFAGRALSLTSEKAAAAAAVLDAKHVLVAHCEGWEHFTEDRERVVEAFQDAGLSEKLCSAAAGQWCTHL